MCLYAKVFYVEIQKPMIIVRQPVAAGNIFEGYFQSQYKSTNMAAIAAAGAKSSSNRSFKTKNS